MMDSILINVPVSSPLHPQANLPFLKGFLTQKGFKVKIFDTNIRFFNWMLSDYQFDIKKQLYIENPVALLDLYNKIEDALSKKCREYIDLTVDLRTISSLRNLCGLSNCTHGRFPKHPGRGRSRARRRHH